MSLTPAQETRLKIQDFWTLQDRQLFGDGTASSFLLGHRNVISGVAYTPVGITAWGVTAATFNESGMVSFARAIPEGSAFRITYQRAAFNDAEIDQFLERGGNVYGAAKEAVQALMFDGLRRAEWQAPDGSSYDDTAALQLLGTMHRTLEDELAQFATTEGGIVEWSVNAGRWYGGGW